MQAIFHCSTLFIFRFREILEIASVLNFAADIDTDTSDFFTTSVLILGLLFAVAVMFVSVIISCYFVVHFT